MKTMHWTNRVFLSFVLTNVVSLLLLATLANSQTETTLYSFTGGADGGRPQAGLVRDAKGNFYGTTSKGGAYSRGTVFELSPAGKYTVLYNFGAPPDGSNPYSGLVRDSKGNLYGTTPLGGVVNGICNADCGTVFELVRNGETYTEKVLYAFTGGGDGSNPYGGLVRDKAGNLYGVTYAEGSTICLCGTVFELTSTGSMVTLYQFVGGTDGANPFETLIRDSKGTLYGTTEKGGNTICPYPGCGTIFEVTTNGTEKILHSFSGSDGAGPLAGLLRDTKGNLYGTATWGGPENFGNVFKLAKNGVLTVLHTFIGGDPGDGSEPAAALVMDKLGNLYGTTAGGGYNYGTVFELTANGDENILYGFIGRSDGSEPLDALVLDQQGNLYGTTPDGGDFGFGTVFVLQPGPKLLSIAINPPNAQMGIGDTFQFVAFGVYSDGTRKGITSLVTWSSSNASVATIQSGGLATGISMGTTTIMASYEGVTGNASLTVN